MAKVKKKFWLVAVFLLFIVYFFVAARPIPPETVLKVRWLSSLESDRPVIPGESSRADTAGVSGGNDPAVLPFTLGGHFGYVDTNGRFIINREKQENLSLSAAQWAEYGAQPDSLEIRDNSGEIVETIVNPRGYPLFLDGRAFILGSEQNSLSETDGKGGVLWNHEFTAPLTCVDAAGGLVLAGSIDGVVEVLDSSGKQVFSFKPGGSQYDLILGCVFSRNGSRLAIVSGIGAQRFLLLERSGGAEYRVVYHEFLGDGFRRPVHVAFIDGDRRVVFEREGGICVYDIEERGSYNIELEGEVAAMDQSGSGGQLFVIVKSDPAGRKKLVGIKLPQKVFIRAPFRTDDVFLGRSGSLLCIGGGNTLASFELEKR